MVAGSRDPSQQGDALVKTYGKSVSKLKNLIFYIVSLLFSKHGLTLGVTYRCCVATTSEILDLVDISSHLLVLNPHLVTYNTAQSNQKNMSAPPEAQHPVFLAAQGPRREVDIGIPYVHVQS